MKRVNLSPFPHSLTIFFIFSFSPFSRILDARMQQVLQPWQDILTINITVLESQVQIYVLSVARPLLRTNSASRI